MVIRPPGDGMPLYEYRVKGLIIMRLLLTVAVGLWGISAMAATGTIAGDNVNVRRAASRTAGVLLKLDRNFPVEVISVEKGWVKVGIREVYVFAQYVKDGVAEAGVNLRSGPGTKYDRLGVLTKNTGCEVLSKQDKWLKVRFNTPVVQGFVAESLVKYEGKPAPAAPQEKPQAKPQEKTEEPKAPASRDTGITADPGDEKWYGNLPIDPGSGRDVTVRGLFYPLGKDQSLKGIRYALWEYHQGKPVLACYVFTGDSDAKYKKYANKQVEIVGDWYEVEGWKKPVMKPRRLRPRE